MSCDKHHRIALVDGDIYIFQAAVVAETPTDWGNGLWTLHADQREAEVMLHQKLYELQATVDADEVIVALSSRENFRKDILPTYKGNRKDVRKPMLIPALRQYVQEQFQTYERPGLEGDDILGILATWDGLRGTKIIVTGDKDMYTIPGYVYMSHKHEFGIAKVSEEDARYQHMLQTLTGDTTDGYSGCPGVGPVKARKVLDAVEGEPKDYWGAVVKAYEKAGLSEEEALVQARVAYILQASHYDFHNKEPILWTP